MLRITKVFSFLFLVSMVTVSSVDAQVPVPVSDGGVSQSQDCGGCSASFGDCGQPGALFGRRQAGNCGDCGSTDCGGGCAGGGGSVFGNGSSGSLMDRARDWFLPSDGCGGRYRSVFLGWSDMQDYDGTDPTGGQVGATFNDGFLLGTARGRFINKHLRMELESTWRNNSGDDWLIGGNAGPLDGQFNMFSTMINTVREFGDGRLRPYVGGGIGLGIQDGDFDVNGVRYRLDDWTFAYQGIIGLNMNFNPCKSRDFYCEYRYYGNTTTQLEANGFDVDDFDFQSENIVFGIRIKR